MHPVTLTLVRNVTIAASEEVTFTLYHHDLAWLDTPEGQDWLDAAPNTDPLPPPTYSMPHRGA